MKKPHYVYRFLASLPGKPIHHLRALMILTIALNVNPLHIFSTGVEWLVTLLMFYVLFVQDVSLSHKEIVDTRYYLLVRTFVAAFFLSLPFQVAQSVLLEFSSGSGITLWRWVEMAICLMIMPPCYRFFTAVNQLGRELPSWLTPSTIFRSRVDER